MMQSREEVNNYKSIFKATSLFGGVQVYQIIIGIIKSKLIALILGSTGMGVQGLFQSALDLIRQFTSFGLAQSAVKDISAANNTNNQERISRTIIVLRRIVWITGLLGCILTIIFSQHLSYYTFGNDDYTLSFVFLSIIMLLDQVCAGQKVLLQGLRKLKDLAKTTAIGSTLGLIVSIPLYYLLGVKGIVPTLILNSVSALLLSWWYSRKIHVQKIPVSASQVAREGRNMISMGVALSISSILMSVCAFVLRSYIRDLDGTDAIGLFTAGFIIMNTYVGMVFNAMGTDFYPRLAKVATDNNACESIVNKQCEIGLLILAPLLSVCIVFTPFIIKILYSDEFLLSNEYVLYASVGMFFKLVSWCISYQFIAKGASRIFVFNEIAQNAYSLALSLFGYHLGGLQGLGISFSISNLLYLLQVYFVARKKYVFSFSKNFWLLFVSQISMFLILFSVVFLFEGAIKYILGISFITGISVYSLTQLKSRMRT